MKQDLQDLAGFTRLSKRSCASFLFILKILNILKILLHLENPAHALSTSPDQDGETETKLHVQTSDR